MSVENWIILAIFGPILILMAVPIVIFVFGGLIQQIKEAWREIKNS